MSSAKWLAGLLVALLAASCAGNGSDASSLQSSAPLDAEPATSETAAGVLPNPQAAPLSDPATLDSLLPVAPEEAAPQNTDPLLPENTDGTVAAGASQMQPKDSFALAYLLATTGDLAVLAAPLITAIQLAVLEANAAGYQEVSLRAADTASDVTTSQEAAESLLTLKTDGVIGALTSTLSLSVINQFIESETPMVSPSSTAPLFTDYNDNGYFFRTAPSDSLRGKVLGDVISADGAQRVAVVYRDDDYGTSLAETTLERLESKGLEVVAEIKTEPEAGSFLEEIATIQNSAADAVVLITFEEGAVFLAEWMLLSGALPNVNQDSTGGEPDGVGGEPNSTGEELEAKPEAVNFYFAEQMVNFPWEDEVIAKTPLLRLADADFYASRSGIGRIKGIATGQQTEVEKTFAQRFEFFVGSDGFACEETMSDAVCEAAKNLGPFVAEAYDAAVILLLASLQAGDEPVADHINEVTRNGIKCSHYVGCAAQIAAGLDINYEGVSGPLDFTDAGEPRQGTYQTWEINDLNQLQFGETVFTVS